MADIGINYDAQVQPSPIRIQLGLSFDNTTLKAKVTWMDPFVIVLKPSGNVAEIIMSGIVYPLAQTLGATLPPLARSLFDGFSLDVLAAMHCASQLRMRCGRMGCHVRGVGHHIAHRRPSARHRAWFRCQIEVR